MTKRAKHVMNIGTNLNVPYTMKDIWNIGQIVTVAGTKYRIEENGWKRL